MGRSVEFLVRRYFRLGEYVLQVKRGTIVMGMYAKRLLGISSFLFVAIGGQAQTPAPAAPSQEPAGAPTSSLKARPVEGRTPALFGKIAAMGNGSIQLSTLDGTTATVKITDKTEYRKDRQAAKLQDFRVGDIVFVRLDEKASGQPTAQLIASRSGAGPEGGRGPGSGMMMGEMGKDFIVGEVKSVDAPKLTVLRPDNVTQTLELTEETSLRRGRESVTMADIQPGDHVVVHGAVENNTFVPKNVMVLSPEQWKRMEEMRKMMTGAGSAEVPKSQPPQQ